MVADKMEACIVLNHNVIYYFISPVTTMFPGKAVYHQTAEIFGLLI